MITSNGGRIRSAPLLMIMGTAGGVWGAGLKALGHSADGADMSGSCPSCGATVRAGDPWCTLCWTDLRPKPAPVPAPAVAPAAPAAAVPAANAPALDPFTAPLESLPPLPPPPPPPVDPLTAPLSAVLSKPLAADPGAPAGPEWPCVECGGRSPIEAAACVTCGTPFGGRIARLDDAKAVRQRRMFVGIGVVVAFLVLLAALTMALTKPPPADGPAPGGPVVELPQ